MEDNKLVICARCGSDACLEVKANDEVSMRSCFGCGFVTSTFMREGEEFYEMQTGMLPELYKDLMFEDAEGFKWMPNTVNVPDKGMVFAAGKTLEDWKWTAVKAVKIEESERKKFPIPNTKDQYYEYKMDTNTTKTFAERDYMEALDYVGLLANPA